MQKSIPNNNGQMFPFPDLLASNDEKASKKFGVNYAKAIWSRYLYADFSIYQKIGRFVENRKYAEGLQSIDKYKDMLDIKGDTSYLNLDFQSVSVIPKFVNLVIGEMINQEFKIQCNALDESSMKDYEEQKRKIYANMLMKDFSDKMEEMTGLGLVDKSIPVPKDKEEADIFIDTTLKQAVEIAMEVCIQFVNDSNNFDKEIKERIIRDLIVLKIAATREYFDENDDIRVRYVDPVNLVLPYSTSPYYREAEYIGEVKKMSFHELMELAGDQFTKEQWEEIKNQIGNSPSSYTLREENGRYYNGNTYGGNKNSDFYVTVLDFEFRSNNHKVTYEKKYINDDNFFLNKKSPDYIPNPDSKTKKEVFSNSYQVFYEGMWIVGTEYIMNYGLQKNMKREKTPTGAYSGKAKSRYNIIAPNIYDGENKSLVETMIPHDDQIMLAFLKLQQALIKARPAGISVDAGALENVLYGKGEEFMDPQEIVEIFDQTGNLYYRSESLEGDGGVIYNQKPIQELANGLSQSAMSFVAIYQHNLDMIRNITGINEFRDGSTPDSKTLSGVMKSSVSMSRNSSRFLNEAFLWLFGQTAKGIALMVQLKSMADGLKGFELALGKESIDVLEITDKLSFSTLGIEIVPLPDAEERSYLDQLIEKAITAGSIELEDAMQIRDVAKVNVKKATHLLKKLRKDKQEQDMKMAEHNSQLNMQSQTQSAMAIKQAEMQLKQMEHQFELEKMQVEFNFKMQLAKLEGRIDAEIEMVKGEEKMEQIKAAMEADMDDSEAKGTRQPSIFSLPPGGQMKSEDFD